jgi:hypothetical protein
MNRKKRMWLELGALFLGASALLALAHIPIETHAVVIEMPEPASRHAFIDSKTFSFWFHALFIAAVAGTVAWIVRKIVQRTGERD